MLLYFGLNRIAWSYHEVTGGVGVCNIPPSHPLRKVIDEDIDDFRTAFKRNTSCGTWSVTGSFEKSPHHTNIWVYAHSTHVKNSDATYDNFRRRMNIELTKGCTEKFNSTNHNCELLLPFFCDNTTLVEYWKDLGRSDLAQECETAMQTNPTLDTGIYASQGCTDNTSGREFHKSTWSKRLVGALSRHLPNHNIKYIVELARHFGTYQQALSLLGNSPEIVRCYAFRGATDICINKKRYIQVEVDDDDIDASPRSSSGEGLIEVGRQAYPPKLGEIIAAIINSAIQKTFIKKKLIKKQVIRSGMYLTKVGAPFIVTLEMPIVHVDHLRVKGHES